MKNKTFSLSKVALATLLLAGASLGVQAADIIEKTKELTDLIESKVTFKMFFQEASLNQNTKRVICGYRVEEIENSLTQETRYLDKLVHELARGRKMKKILRVT